MNNPQEVAPEYLVGKPTRYTARAMGTFLAGTAVLMEVSGIQELMAGNHEAGQELIVQGITPTGLVAGFLIWASFAKKSNSTQNNQDQ